MLERTDAESAFLYNRLRLLRGRATKQQISTIKGQIKSGHYEEAYRGINRLRNSLDRR